MVTAQQLGKSLEFIKVHLIDLEFFGNIRIGVSVVNLNEVIPNFVKFGHAHALGGEKFKTERCSVSYRTSKSIKIDDLKAIPKRFLKEISEEWISKTMIKEVIESGKKVKGAHQEEKMGIVIK